MFKSSEALMKGSKFYDNLLSEHKKKQKNSKIKTVGNGRLQTEKGKFGSF